MQHLLSPIKRDNKTGKAIPKPSGVVEYNNNIGAVGQGNMQICFSQCLRKVVEETFSSSNKFSYFQPLCFV